MDSLSAVTSPDTTRRMFMARVDSMFVVNDMLSEHASLRGGFVVLTRNYQWVGAWR
jgi:hypothetical protein